MQIDFHYYVTYALAYLAGFSQNNARIIATSSQFVDELASTIDIEFKDGGAIMARATAHHTCNLRNLSVDDQRQVWIPFHFLPGAKADDEYTHRLCCVENSPVAKDMMNEAIARLRTDVGLYRLGIATHVYQDTFSHYGFSGVSSRRNKIDNDSFTFNNATPKEVKQLKDQEKRFKEKYGDPGLFANFKSFMAELFSGALGHGAAITYPDLPYLEWDFVYDDDNNRLNEFGSDQKRSNPESFWRSCEALFEYFVLAAETIEANPNKKSMEIDGFKKIIAKREEDLDKRVQAWRAAANKGQLAKEKFSIPEFAGEKWLEELQHFQWHNDSSIALNNESFLFLRAASAHRNYVLRELLPAHDLVVA